MFDLLLRGGTVIDPSQGLNGPLDVAIAGGSIVLVGPQIPDAEARRVVDVSGKMVTPGLVDLHAHVYPGVTSNGVDADEYCLKHGSTTVVDGGSAGACTIGGFTRWIVKGSRTHVLSLLSISVLGQMGYRKTAPLGNPAYADTESAVAAIRANAGVVVGLWEEGEFPLADGVGELRVARRKLVPDLVVRQGDLV